LVFSITAIAEIRFVSKTGTSIPPYTSWATAADSIQKAINICNPGDTVYVGNGVYKEQVTMGDSLALIGSGMDSCIIDIRDDRSIYFAVVMQKNGHISGFSILLSHYGANGHGIWSMEATNYCEIINNKIEAFWTGSTGIHVSSWSNILVKNNYFINTTRALILSEQAFQIIENNLFVNCRQGVYAPFPVKAIIKNNIFMMSGKYESVAVFGSNHDSLFIYNNLCISKTGEAGLGNSNRPAIINNNLLIGHYSVEAIFLYEPWGTAKNNLLIDCGNGIKVFTGSGEKVKFNNSWGRGQNYIGFAPDSTNFSIDPMVVNDDTANYDFHLQKYSPMIDAGDPTILDVDGTRSDIGLYGGPYGESYTYQDLAPRVPKNVTATINETALKLNWVQNTEADFAYYRIYRDTIPGFLPDTTKRIAKTNDTTYTELFKPGRNYYYKISATDNQGNESPKSEEVKLITGVNDNPVIKTEDYTLFANYPNPFNPSTRICYRLNKPGNVSLKVYDIKGSLVKQILNKWHEAGYYEEEFTGEKKQANDYIERFASGVYVLVIEIKNENNLPVYSNSRKMMMVK